MNRTFQPIVCELKQIDIQRPISIIMPNGISLNIINSGEQEVTRLDLIFRGGRWHQSQKLQALFTNRMLREGSRSYTSTAIAAKLDYYGSWLDLSTSVEHSYITLYSLNKYFKETLEILESVIKEPVFPEKELSTVIDSNIQQFQVNSTKVDYLAHRSLLNASFGDQHPCGQILGEEDYRNITPKALHEFYDTHYHSGNCTIYLSGKVTDEIIQNVQSVFGTEPFGDTNRQIVKQEYAIVTASEKKIFTERADAMQSAVKMGNLTIERTHPDYLKLRVLITLFGGYFGSRLMSNIREDKGYTYGISAGILFYPDNGLLMVSTEAANEYVEPLITEVYHEIDKLQNETVGQEELSMVKNYMVGEMCRNYESPFSISDAWIFILTTGLADDYFSHSLQAIKEVTPQELRDLACRYLCKEKLKEVVAGKKMS
ncbi:pitrilysin family protein [uncultured Bacteroides sp.]|uniref:M16 family metallopeptidase n=1 Tax=uncultured Bacteroides sp. TaxID=162156 RepID=UPI002AA90F88|nr:pitrilysin family protein [uncultured Bacteroides sp.]